MWTANLFQVTTGAIGPQVNFKTLSWSVDLNSPETIELDLTKSDLPALNLNYWLAPWWAGVVLLWDGTPIAAGPIVSRPSESFYTIKVTCAGMRSIFAHRFVINEQINWDDLSRTSIPYTKMSYGTMAKKAVQQALLKPGGYLPINFPIADDFNVPDDLEHHKDFAGYDFGTTNCEAILTDLAGKHNGPDVMFKPRLIDGNSLTFDMFYGSETNPYLPQNITPIWDSTTTKGGVSDLDIVATGSYQTFRAFATAVGGNAGTLIKVAEDDSYIAQGWPMLESTQDYGSESNETILQNNANAMIVANKNAKLEIQMTVRTDGEFAVGTYWPGNSVQLVTKGWLSLKDGVHNLRLLNMTGTNDNNVRMSLQTEE